MLIEDSLGPTMYMYILMSGILADVRFIDLGYAVGAISYMCVARFSDWKQMRGIPVVALCLVSVLGYALLISPISPSGHYAGCFLVALGLYVAVGIPLAWLPTNNPRFGTSVLGQFSTFPTAVFIVGRTIEHCY